MRTQFFSQMSNARLLVGLATREVSEEEANAIPKGFTNNIRWQVGHLLMCAENLLLTQTGLGKTVPSEWGKYFLPGTSPNDFSTETPSFKELRAALKNQTEQIPTLISKNWDRELSHGLTLPRTTITTVEDAFLFCLFHEGLHLGQVQSIRRLVSGNG